MFCTKMRVCVRERVRERYRDYLALRLGEGRFCVDDFGLMDVEIFEIQ